MTKRSLSGGLIGRFTARAFLAGLLCTAMLSAPSSARAEDPPNAARPARVDRRRTPVVEVIEQSRNAVVNISTSRRVQYRYRPAFGPFDDVFNFGAPPVSDEVTSVGSGAVIHPDGYIVTNAHVVAQASDVRVNFFDKTTRPAQIVAVDAEHDLAILKVDGAERFAALKLGRSHDILIGETVVAIGNPLGLNNTVTSGIVSALDRELKFSPNVTYTGLIQTDASINPGNSGGPLLNLNAELIGINSAIRGDAQNIGFAIPVDRLWELIPTMLDVERRTRVRFGLEVDGPSGNITAVRPDSPAARSELRAGDTLVQFNTDKLRDGIDYYVHLAEQKPGARVRLIAKRSGESVAAEIPLEEIPPPDGRKLARALFGLTLEQVPAKLRARREFPQNMGLMVGGVERSSPAEKAGLEEGDLIVSLGGLNVPDFDDAGLVLEQVRPGASVAIDVIRLSSDPPIRGTTKMLARRK